VNQGTELPSDPHGTAMTQSPKLPPTCTSTLPYCQQGEPKGLETRLEQVSDDL